jgi:hypothetical protein
MHQAFQQNLSIMNQAASTSPPLTSPSPPTTFSESQNSYANLIRPNPIHAAGSRSIDPSPHISLANPQITGSRPAGFGAADEGKVVVSIDFGAGIVIFSNDDMLNHLQEQLSLALWVAYRCSIVISISLNLQAYGSSRIASGKVQQILHWPGSFETFRKVPTCLLYDENGQVLAWGLEAKNAGPMPGTTRCEWYCPQFIILRRVMHRLLIGSNCVWSPTRCEISLRLILVYHSSRSVLFFSLGVIAFLTSPAAGQGSN